MFECGGEFILHDAYGHEVRSATRRIEKAPGRLQVRELPQDGAEEERAADQC